MNKTGKLVGWVTRVPVRKKGGTGQGTEFSEAVTKANERGLQKRSEVTLVAYPILMTDCMTTKIAGMKSS